MILVVHCISFQVSDQFSGLDSGLSLHCIYGGVSYGPQGMVVFYHVSVVNTGLFI